VEEILNRNVILIGSQQDFCLIYLIGMKYKVENICLTACEETVCTVHWQSDYLVVAMLLQ
jgi:hypothetical protein